jgi:putative serine protease PepD
MSEHSSDPQSHTHRYGPSTSAPSGGAPSGGAPSVGSPSGAAPSVGGPSGAGQSPPPPHHGMASPPPLFPGAGPLAPPPPPPPRRRGPAIVVAAVLAGALAGTGGAASYAALTDDGTTTPTATSLDTTPVNNTRNDNDQDGAVEQVATAVQPSVVQINTSAAQGSGNGTGIIISADGQILTNNHVVESADSGGGSITVIFSDGSTADATVVGRDPVTDVAVIQAEDVSGLEPATLGTSDDLEVGEEVVAIGSPFGLESTVTSGIVSALNRPVTASSESSTSSTVFPAIQTDAAINPGNSGGPLVNMNGQVIGINSAIYGETGGSIGLGFAIPIDLARAIASQLVDGETPTHARIGISVSDAVQSDQITTVGARVEEVTDGSAGEAAGLEAGDIVTAVDGQRVTSANGLIALIRTYRPGDEVKLSYLRDDEEHETSVTLDSDEGDLNS